MSTCRPVRIAVLSLCPLLLLVAAQPAAAGTNQFEVSFGADFLNSTPPCPVNAFPGFEVIAPVPAIFDLFPVDPLFDCFIDVQKNEKGVRNAKGRYMAEVIIRDNDTGDLESFPVGSGRFKTDSDGRAQFDFDLPSELFADGFESGDVSAWSYTRTDFTNKKKADAVGVQCGKGASRSE